MRRCSIGPCMTDRAPPSLHADETRARSTARCPLFTEVRAGEGDGALLLAANIFSLLLFYRCSRSSATSLILSEGGAVAKSYSAAGQALLLFVIVPLYGAFASSVNRVRLICGVTLFFASHLMIFYAARLGRCARRDRLLHVDRHFQHDDAGAVLGVCQRPLQHRTRQRLFPIVGIGASLGALIGAGLATNFFAGTGPYLLMLIAAVGLMLPIAFTVVGEQARACQRTRQGSEARAAARRGRRLSARLPAALPPADCDAAARALNLVNTIGEFVLVT